MVVISRTELMKANIKTGVVPGGPDVASEFMLISFGQTEPKIKIRSL